MCIDTPMWVYVHKFIMYCESVNRDTKNVTRIDWKYVFQICSPILVGIKIDQLISQLNDTFHITN